MSESLQTLRIVESMVVLNRLLIGVYICSDAKLISDSGNWVTSNLIAYCMAVASLEGVATRLPDVPQGEVDARVDRVDPRVDRLDPEVWT